MKKHTFHAMTLLQITILSLALVLLISFLIYAFMQVKETGGKYALAAIMFFAVFVFSLMTLKNYKLEEETLQKRTILFLRKEETTISQIANIQIFPIRTSRPSSSTRIFVAEVKLKNNKLMQFIFFDPKNKDKFKDAMTRSHIRVIETEQTRWEAAILHDLRILLN